MNWQEFVPTTSQSCVNGSQRWRNDEFFVFNTSECIETIQWTNKHVLWHAFHAHISFQHAVAAHLPSFALVRFIQISRLLPLINFDLKIIDDNNTATAAVRPIQQVFVRRSHMCWRTDEHYMHAVVWRGTQACRDMSKLAINFHRGMNWTENVIRMYRIIYRLLFGFR